MILCCAYALCGHCVVYVCRHMFWMLCRVYVRSLYVYVSPHVPSMFRGVCVYSMCYTRVLDVVYALVLRSVWWVYVVTIYVIMCVTHVSVLDRFPWWL